MDATKKGFNSHGLANLFSRDDLQRRAMGFELTTGALGIQLDMLLIVRQALTMILAIGCFDDFDLARDWSLR